MGRVGARLYALYGHIARLSQWAVDRFHFAHHAPHDDVCDQYCSPYSHEMKSMVHLISRKQVVGLSPNAVMNGRIGVKSRVKVAGEFQQRRTFCRGPDANGHFWEFVVRDMGNTEVAEQTFSYMGGFGGVVRSLSCPYSELFLHTMAERHNVHISRRLTDKGCGPSPAGEPHSAAWVRRPSYVTSFGLVQP